MDCGVDLGFSGSDNGHYYMVHDHVWLRAVPDARGQLCLDCLQVRLGRALSADDFLITPSEMFERLYFPVQQTTQTLMAYPYCRDPLRVNVWKTLDDTD